jgi:hypothetical protein
MIKTLTDAERIARDKKREKWEQEYTQKWKIKNQLMAAKIKAAGITVTKQEIDAELKKLGL